MASQKNPSRLSTTTPNARLATTSKKAKSKVKRKSLDGEYEGWHPPLPISREADALEDLRTKISPKEVLFLTVSSNSACINPARSNEFAPLHHLCVKPANNNYYFDGILEEGQICRYVQKVPFMVLSIGNDDQIWIQSIRLEGSDVWYQLGAPAPEYERYHREFVWLANFVKHFTDFLDRHTDDVHVYDFCEKFYLELEALHGADAAFRAWLKQYGDTNFRRVVAANPEFLWKESVDISKRNALPAFMTFTYRGGVRLMPTVRAPVHDVSEEGLHHIVYTQSPSTRVGTLHCQY
ncbi:MAG: DNA methyltransferase Dim-2 [Peltula sp. TS41687]|nr:MAG: DNA methyltransferase Dim-2 [Peltula sp. TS41687]